MALNVDFSTIIPTFRRPNELLATIGSVVAQRDIEWEIFVIDDCPDGSARHLVESLNDRRINYIRNPKPSGGVPSSVRNLGWPLARGMFVHFLDDDDIVPEDHYATVKKAFLDHPEVGVVFGRVEPFGDVSEDQMQHERDFFAGAARRASISGRFGPKWAFTARMMFNGLLLVTGAGVVRRECVQALGGFDPAMRVREDWDFYARAMRRFGAHFLDRVALKYRISERSLLHYSVDLTETDLRYLTEARQRKRAKYRAERGAVEYYAVKLFAKTILTVL